MAAVMEAYSTFTKVMVLLCLVLLVVGRTRSLQPSKKSYLMLRCFTRMAVVNG